VKGKLAEVGIADIVKAFSLIGKSGKLIVKSNTAKGTVFLRQGRVFAAEAGAMRGEDALYAMSLWTSGEFQYDSVMTLVEQNIHAGTESLFIGLSSKVDRYHYLLSRCPPLNARLELSETLERSAQQDAETNKLYALLRRKPLIEDVLEAFPYDKLTPLDQLARLYTSRQLTVIETVPPPAAAEQTPALEANVKQVNIGELAQILVLIKRNGRLTAVWDDREGEVFIQHGNITYAAVESLEGEGAVYRLLTWKDGYCKFFANLAPAKPNVDKNIESIFFEGIDVLAEFNKFMDEFPSLNAYIDVISVTGQETITSDEATILKLVNQNETLKDVIKHSPFSDLETLKLTARLYNQRMIGLSKGARGQREVDYDKEAEDLLKDLL
jgi:hypothetical protein